MKALITGASSGIGKDMAKYLSLLGYDLILVARRKDKLEELSTKLSTNIHIISLDLSKKENCYKLYEKLEKEDIDILINNAGFGLFGDFNETDLDTELEMINTNIIAVHILTKLFLQKFIKKDNGYILNVASAAGFSAGPHLSTYYATKNYVLKLTEAIYQELKEKKSKVHISALCPGPVNTEFNKVAKGTFTVKGLKSYDVAKLGVDKLLQGKLIIIPGMFTKLGIFAKRFICLKTELKIVSNIQISKNK